MPLSPVLAAWLNDQGHDAVHAGGIGLFRAPDHEIISYAVAEGRTIITADLDYPRLLALAEAREPCLILFRGGNWSDADVVARMKGILPAISSLEAEPSILVVDRERIRCKVLPISR